jgi:uracil-DNA glycosylase family 4
MQQPAGEVSGKYIGGSGTGRKFVWVGEAPGRHEDEAGMPFVGPSGHMIDKALQELGHQRSEGYFTNVVKYRPPGNDLKRLKEIGHTVEENIPQLWQEIAEINPNVVIACGNLALKVLTGKSGILKWRGSIIKSINMDKKVVPIVHPAAFMNDPSGREAGKGRLDPRMKYIWKMDIARAMEESRSNFYDVPELLLEVARDHVTLQRFLEKYQGCTEVSIDIEVYKSIPVCIAFAFNNWHGISVPLLDIYSWQKKDGIPAHELARLWQLVASVLADPKISKIGQNIKFDHTSLESILGMPVNGEIIDIMILAHSLYPEFPKKLAFHQSVWTRHPFHKDEGKDFDIKKDDIRQYLHYNAKDAVVTMDLKQILHKQVMELQVPGFPNWGHEFVYDYAMKLHDFYKRMESVGIKTNIERQKELIAEYEGRIKLSQAELNDICKAEINVNSHVQVKNLLFGDFGLPRRVSTDEDSLVSIAANNCKKPEHKRAIDLILEIRRQRKALGTYFKARPDFDGRMRTNYKICGTETGRSSTGILKPPVRPYKVGLAFHTLTKHGDIGPEIRSEFEADDGYTIVEIDMSQAEARIVALLGNDEKTLDMFARKIDIHSLTAGWIFGVDPSRVKLEYPEFRFIGKTVRHAGNYDMQKKRLMQIVNTDAKKFGINISISEWKAGQILDKFHKFAPNIRGVFHEEIRRALVDNGRVLVNPYGRYRMFFGESGHDLDKEGYAHIPQSTVPDHLRHAGLRAEARFRDEGVDARYFLEGHDSLIGLVRDDCVARYTQILFEEIERPIDFSRCTIQRGSLVIPAEAKIGKNYKECKTRGCKGCKYLHDYTLPKAA